MRQRVKYRDARTLKGTTGFFFCHRHMYLYLYVQICMYVLLLQVSKQLVPLYVGFTVLGIGICFGFNSGYAINPARDLAPRLFTSINGYYYNCLFVVVFMLSVGVHECVDVCESFLVSVYFFVYLMYVICMCSISECVYIIRMYAILCVCKSNAFSSSNKGN